MTFAWPIGLLALVPLAAVVAWMLWGRRRRRVVPFLNLWRGPVQSPPTKRSLILPPMSAILTLLAILLAILGAAGPRFGSAPNPVAITLIVDRGATMSGRIGSTIEAISPRIERLASGGRVDVQAVPAAAIETLTEAARLEAVGRDTHAALEASASEALRRTGGVVAVITDQELTISDPRLVRIAPARSSTNAGIIALSARAVPRSQVMVRLGNFSSRRKVTLRVSSGGVTVERTVAVNDSGDDALEFIDFPQPLGERIAAEITPGDDIPFDDAATIVRRHPPPRIEPGGAISEDLTRFIEVYQRHHPAGADSPALPVVKQSGELGTGSGVIVAEAAAATADSAMLVIAPHPLTESVDFSAAASAGAVAPKGWTPLVTRGDAALLAYRQAGGSRAVWTCLGSGPFAREPSFVILWTNIFDWAGLTAEEYVPLPEKSGMRLRLGPAGGGDFSASPDSAMAAAHAGGRATATDRRPAFIAAAMVLCIAAAWLWKSKSS